MILSRPLFIIILCQKRCQISARIFVYFLAQKTYSVLTLDEKISFDMQFCDASLWRTLVIHSFWRLPRRTHLTHTCVTYWIWQYGSWSFQTGVQNLQDFCLRINIPKGNFWILKIGLMGSLISLQKLEF